MYKRFLKVSTSRARNTKRSAAWRCLFVISTAFAHLLILEVKAQVFNDSSKMIAEGGMRFSRKDKDTLQMSNLSTSGLRASGSAAVRGGSIKVGSAASDIVSELNPVTVSSDGVVGTLFVAGNQSEWETTYNLQKPQANGTKEVFHNRVSRGVIDQRLIDELVSIQPAGGNSENPLIKNVQFTNSSGEELSRKVQFTDNYNDLVVALEARKSNGELKTNGVHVINFTSEDSPDAKNLRLNSLSPVKQPFIWASSESGESIAVQVTPTFRTYQDPDNSGNPIRIKSLQSSGASHTSSRFTILGFSENLNPNDGKKSSLSAFATNNRSVGSVKVQTGQTLADLALLYGTSVESLVEANNLPSTNVNLDNISLVVPADLSTIGYEISLEGESIANMAKRFYVDVSWLMDLNNIADPGEMLPAGTRVRIPGRRPLGSPILPPAKPSAPELEYADYGAYTSYQVIYHVQGSVTPLFVRRLSNVFD